MTPARKRSAVLACAPLLAAALAGCGSTVSTSAFQGEQHAAAQAIANLQSDVTAGDEQKICGDDLAGAVVGRLRGAPGGCRQVIKNQLAELDNFDVSVKSVQLTPTGAPHAATAHVTSVYGGKTRAGTVQLVKEGGRWKVAAVQ
jgi:hypothetical protein